MTHSKLSLHKILTLVLLLFPFLAISAPIEEREPNPLSGIASLTDYSLVPQKPFELTVQLTLPEGFRAYADEFRLDIESPEGFKFNSLKVEPQQSFFDEISKKKKMGVIGHATLVAPIESPAHLPTGNHIMKIAIHYRACTKSYCLFPKKLLLEIPFTFMEEKLTPPAQSTPVSPMSLNFEQAMQKGLVWAFLVVFVAGFLTSLTPCIFPIIPITIAVLGRHAHLHSKRKNLLLSILYVLGIALTYAALGIFAAGTGVMFGSFMSHPVVLGAICAVFLAMALSMFGAFELQAPEFVRRRLSGDLHIHGYSSAFIYGVIAGIVAGPCVGPVLVGILTFVAKTQNLWLGFWLLFIFAIGMGALFIAIGFSSQVTKLLPKSGAWMESIKHAFGLLMMVAVFYYLGLLVPIRWWDGALGLSLVIGGSFFGAFESIHHLSTLGKIRKGLCQTLIFIGAAFITVGIFDLRPYLKGSGSGWATAPALEQEAQWLAYSQASLDQAKAAGKPVMIDFWAEWCGACKELEQYTFTKDVFKQMAKDFVLLKFDATNETEELNRLREKYKIVGLPSLIFYDSKGRVQLGDSVTQFMEAPELVKVMQTIKDRSN